MLRQPMGLLLEAGAYRQEAPRLYPQVVGCLVTGQLVLSNPAHSGGSVTAMGQMLCPRIE
jgi:hypothetical protein